MDEPRQPSIALVTGAADGIGLALVARLLERPCLSALFASTRNKQAADTLNELGASDPRLRVIEMDLTDAEQLESATATMRTAGHLDLVVNTAGVLHDGDNLRPERRLAEVRAANLLRAFETNALGALLLAQAVEPLLRAAPQPVFASLSARVASIGDNRLGGWYAYRASKAALNMLVKTLSIEWSRYTPPITAVALHPGTVRTALSAPFIAGRKDQLVFTPTLAADYLLEVIESLTPSQSGRFYAYDGREIPW
jgi:NAD(P)-dependent dehydrogenase (short-subunit alcohol dehydrogenase family)